MPSFRTTRLVAFLTLAPIVGCECDPEVAAIAPQIYLDVCKKPQRKVNGDFIGGFEQCRLDFGDVDISVKATKTITVTNPSKVKLILKNIELSGDPSFKLESFPDEIAPGFNGIITVSVRPRTETEITGKLYVLSDANNTEQTENDDSLIEIPLTARGVDNGIPDIKVEPTDCDFDHVAVGGVASCPITVRNLGNRGLVLDSVAFIPTEAGPLFQVPTESVRGGPDGTCDPTSDDGCAFSIVGRPPGPDEEIAPDASFIMQLHMNPDALGNFSGLLRILSNDPDDDDAEIDVTMHGIGVTPPQCKIRIKSVNGVEVGDSIPEIEPLDNVILSLDESTPAIVDGAIARWEWSIPANGRPAGSTVTLTSPSDETTGFTFDDDLGIDLAGTYTVRARVFDDLGTNSVNECEISFESIPKDHFLTQLTWDTPENDLDLHITKKDDNGNYCITNTSGDPVTGLLAENCANGTDCNFSTCQGGGPEWDGVDGETEGDPSLDIDDINGFGPENTNVDIMGPGSYLIGVNEYAGTSEYEAGATVRIFVFGRIAYEAYKELAVGEWWEVAVVHWPTQDEIDEGTLPCVEDLNDGDVDDECGP